MKLVLFSPMGTTSAIGRVTALIVPELITQGHEVTVIRTEKQELLDSTTHPCPARILPWTDEAAVLAAVDDADGLAYQIGNNFAFHIGGLHWLANRPGLVCLHDFIVAHLFAGWAENREEEARQVLVNWYGEEVAHRFFSAKDARQFIESASRDHPMTEWICAMAHAVISHSHWGMDRVAAACGGPVRMVPLPYSAPAAPPAARREEDRKTVRLLTIGHANVNKRIETVIRAVGSSTKLRGCVRYRLCGLIEPAYALELARMARASGVHITISGEVDPVGLQLAIDDADLVCCLRWPSIEAASATAIESMLYGKGLIVTDTGFFRELPDDCVTKVSMGNEIDGLRIALERLSANPAERQAMAVKGQQWARTTFDPGNYARQLVLLTECMLAARPAIDLSSNLSMKLSEWGGSPELLLTDDIAGPLSIFNRST